MILRKIVSDRTEYLFFCPGCKTPHVVNDTWEFNGNFEKPTFQPSVLVTYGNRPEMSDELKKYRCHSFVVDGEIRFGMDCSHELKGKTVFLPPIPEVYLS